MARTRSPNGRSGSQPRIVTTKADGRRVAEHTTARGVDVLVAPAVPWAEAHIRAALSEEWHEAGRVEPTPPTYQIATAAGDVETHEHDATTLVTDEHKAQWAAYLAAKDEFEGEVRNRLWRTMVIDCLDFDIDPKWPAKAKAKGMRVPADEWERKLFFAETEVIGSAEDIVTIMEMAAKLSNADARLMKEAAESSFRGDVEEPDAAAEAPRQTR